MDEAGAIEEDVDGTKFRGKGINGGGIADIEWTDTNSRTGGREFCEEIGADVGGEDLGAFAGEGCGGGCADSLARSGQQSFFTLEAAGGHDWRWRPVIFDLADALREI